MRVPMEVRPGPRGGEVDRRSALQLVIHRMAKLAAVIDHGDMAPGIEAVELAAIDEGLAAGGAGGVGIETPLAADQSRFKLGPVLRAVFLEVE